MSWIKKALNRAKGAASSFDIKDTLATVAPLAYLANAPGVSGARSRAEGGMVMDGVASSLSPYMKAMGGTQPTAPGGVPPMPGQETMQDPDALGRAERRRRRMLAAQGRGSTILTGSGSGGSLGLGSGNLILGV